MTVFALTITGVFIFSAVAMAAPKIGKNLEEIKKLAKKEGTVRIATSWRGKIIKVLGKGLKKKYGIKFKLNRVGGLASRERILNEAIGGVVENDLVNVSGELREHYIKAGIIIPVKYTSIFPNFNKKLLSPRNYFVAAGFTRYALVYNTKMVKPGQGPKTWEDCLDKKWKGNLGVYTRPRAFYALWDFWGKEKSLAYHKALKSQKPTWVSNQTSTVTKLSAGEYAMVCGIAFHSVKNVLRRDPTAPIKFVVPPQLPFAIGEAMAVMKGAKAPNGAILLAAYMASEEGQAPYHLYGRSNPFVKGSAAQKVIQETGTKPLWAGWKRSGPVQAAASKGIVSAWGFPKGKK
jgi:iron(III) transport system substrate-binding protein